MALWTGPREGERACRIGCAAGPEQLGRREPKGLNASSRVELQAPVRSLPPITCGRERASTCDDCRPRKIQTMAAASVSEVPAAVSSDAEG